MPSEIRQVIENSHLFSGLEPGLIDDIAASATKRTLGAHELLFQKGDRADALWGVLSGRIVIEVRANDGKEMVLDVFQAGDVFGEVGVLDFGPRRVEAAAACKSELFRLERSHFIEHLQANPELCFRVFSLLCGHLRDTTETLEDTALYKLPSRLAKRLILMKREALNEHGSAVLKVVQSELARMMGVHREAVNRQLREWEKSGWISINRQRIEILEEKRLADLAAPGQIVDHKTWDIESLYRSASARMSKSSEGTPGQPDRRSVGILAVDCTEYAELLMTDSANTIKRIKKGLATIDKAIRNHRGRVIWSAGDRTLAEFPNGSAAVDAALEIQRNAEDADSRTTGQIDPIFHIGIHSGEILVSDGRIIGDPVNVAIHLTRLSGAGGICISGKVRDALEETGNFELQYLGRHELKNVADQVRVFSARTIPWLKRMALRAETLIPRRFRPAVAIAALVALLAGFWFTGDRMGRQHALPAVAQLTIAIMPFTSSEDTTLEYLARGIPEEIRRGLSMVPGLRVIGRESVGYFNDRTASAEEIGRALEVEWLLRGNLEVSGNQINATTQLLNATNNEVAWEEQFLDSHEDFGGFAPEIVQRIAISLGITDGDGGGLPKLVALTTNSEAHALYLEAQSQIWRGRQRYAIKAVPLLQSAVEMDPSFAEAHAVLAGLYLFKTMLDDQEQYNPGIREELARQSLQKALALKPDSPLVLAEASKARRYFGDYEGATALAERALSIDPNNTEALWALYWIEVKQQDLVGALLTSERIMRLEPMSVTAMNQHWNQLYYADRHLEGLAVANRVLALYPEREVPQAHGIWVAMSKLKLGDRLGAIESSRKGMPYGIVDLWTGLEYDWEFFDDLDPVRSATGLVYIEEYDQIRQILIRQWDGDDPDSAGANSLVYLVNRGELEALAGNFDDSLEFFERVRSLVPDEEGGLVRANDKDASLNSYAVLDYSRQSHWSLAALLAYRKAGQHEKAQVIAAQFEALVAEKIETMATVSDLAEFRFLYKEAQYHAIEGRKNVALDKLRTWVDYGVDLFTYIEWDPLLENLRGDPEFEVIVAGVEVELAEIRAQYHAKQAALAEAGSG